MAAKKETTTKTQAQTKKRTTAKKSTTTKRAPAKKTTRTKPAAKKTTIKKAVQPALTPQEWEAQEMDRVWETTLGAPKKFDPVKAMEIMVGYIKDYRDGKWKFHEVVPTSDMGGKLIGMEFPMLEDVATNLGVTYQTFWNNVSAKDENGRLKNQRLFDAAEILKQCHKMQILKGGMKGTLPSALAKFLLSANYGMNEVQEVKVETTNMNKVYDELDEIYEQEATRVAKQKADMNARREKLDEEQAKNE